MVMLHGYELLYISRRRTAIIGESLKKEVMMNTRGTDHEHVQVVFQQLFCCFQLVGYASAIENRRRLVVQVYKRRL